MPGEITLYAGAYPKIATPSVVGLSYSAYEPLVTASQTQFTTMSVDANDKHYLSGVGFMLGYGHPLWWYHPDTKYAALKTVYETRDLNFARIFLPWAAPATDTVAYTHLRTGPGNALDGGLKFDLTQINGNFLARLVDMVAWAKTNGIVVAVTLWHDWPFEEDGDQGDYGWAGSVMNPANNINPQTADIEKAGPSPLPWYWDCLGLNTGCIGRSCWSDPADGEWVRDRTKELFDAVLLNLRPYSNWYIELGNRAYFYQDAKRYWAGYLRGAQHGYDDGAVSAYGLSGVLLIDQPWEPSSGDPTFQIDTGDPNSGSAVVQQLTVPELGPTGTLAVNESFTVAQDWGGETRTMYLMDLILVGTNEGNPAEPHDRTGHRRSAWQALTGGGHWESMISNKYGEDVNDPTFATWLPDYETLRTFLTTSRTDGAINARLPFMQPDNSRITSARTDEFGPFCSEYKPGQTECYLVFANAGTSPTINVDSAGLTITRLDCVTGVEDTDPASPTTAGNNALAGTANDTAWFIGGIAAPSDAVVWERKVLSFPNASYAGNPFELEIDVTFTHTDLTAITLPGYYAGSDTWKVGFMPTKAGTWNYVTSSADADLNGVTGALQVTAGTNRGLLKAHPTNAKKFAYADGTYAAVPLMVRINFFSETSTQGQFDALADWMQTNNIEMLDTRLQPDVLGTVMFTGSWTNHQFNLPLWDQFEARLDALAARGLGVYLMFYTDDSGKPPWDGQTATEALVIRYVVARTAGYPIVFYDSGIDVVEYRPNPGDIEFWGDMVKALDPYDHPVGSRWGTSGVDYTGKTWDSRVDPITANLTNMLTYWNSATIAVGFVDSFHENGPAQHAYKDHTPEDIRRAMWKSVIVGGSAMSVRGADGYYHITTTPTDMESEQWTKLVNPFVEDYLGTTFGTMVPTSSLVTNGYCLADPARTKLLYFLVGVNDRYTSGNGGNITVKLTGLSGSYDAIWFNPRTGAETPVSGTPFAGGSDYSIAPPSTDDWVLLLNSVTVVFSSQWLTATGTSDAARRDTSNPVANGGPFRSTNADVHRVVSGAGYSWPYGNCLAIEQGAGRSTDGACYVGKLGDQNDSPIPANTDYYFRVYVNVWDMWCNKNGSRHPCNTSHQNPYLGLFAVMDATSDKTLWEPGLIRAYTRDGLNNPPGPGIVPGGFWWPGQYPVDNSQTCHSNVWLNQQHWYLFEAHVHWLDTAQKRWFWGSYGVYDAQDNYNQLADLSNYTNGPTGGGQSLEQARLDGAFVYNGIVDSVSPLVITPGSYTGQTYPWQVMIGSEGNAALGGAPCYFVDPNEHFVYAAPAVATGGFPPRLTAL
jgi:hypothetical protein